MTYKKDLIATWQLHADMMARSIHQRNPHDLAKFENDFRCDPGRLTVIKSSKIRLVLEELQDLDLYMVRTIGLIVRHSS